MNEIASSIASSVEEQGVATQEIASNATEASRSTVEVTTNIETVAAAAENTRDTAEKVDSSAQQLKENASMLRNQVGTFLQEVSGIVGMPSGQEGYTYHWQMDSHRLRVDPAGDKKRPIARFEITAIPQESAE